MAATIGASTMNNSVRNTLGIYSRCHHRRRNKWRHRGDWSHDYSTARRCRHELRARHVCGHTPVGPAKLHCAISSPCSRYIRRRLRRISVATSNQAHGSVRGTNKRAVYALHYLMSGWQLAQLNIAHMLAPAESS